MTGTDLACLHTNQSQSYLNHLLLPYIKIIFTQMFFFLSESLISCILYLSFMDRMSHDV